MARMRTLLVVSGVLLAGAGVALAQEGVSGVLLEEPSMGLSPPETVTMTAREDAAVRFASNTADGADAEAPRRLELEFAATGEHAGVPLDVSVAQRASLGAGSDGDLSRQGSGSEVRIGRGLVQRKDDQGEREPSFYMFVASDDEALTWRPGQRNEFGGNRSGFALQDQVEIGDVSAGVTYERGNMQASLAYVEREVSTTVGRESFSQDERFAGVTVTMRR